MRRTALKPLRRRVAALLGLGAAAMLVATGCGGAQPNPSLPTRSVAGTLPLKPSGADWPALLHGPSHFGASPSRGPQRAAVRWTRHLPGAIVAGPVTFGDSAYVASTAGVLHAISLATGADRWTFSGGASYGADLSTGPTVLPEGLILWPGPRNRLFGLDLSGHLRWSLSSREMPLSPIVDPALHLLVIADMSGRLSGYRLAQGAAAPAKLWSLSLAGPSYGNPVLSADGTIYETGGNSLFAVSPRGQLRWQLRTGSSIEVSAAISEDGTVVFGSNDELEYGVSPEGRIRWRHPIGNYTYSSPLALAGDLVAYGNHSGAMTVIDAHSGHVVWTDQGSGQIWTAAAVDARGDAYFASRTGGIYGFAPGGRSLFTIPTRTTYDSYPAIAPDGTLLIGGDDGVLRAIR